MKRMPRRDSKAELRLRRELHRLGLRYRVHLRGLPGTPDIAFTRARIAVFVDGCFWHACPRCYIKPKQNAKFWKDKIGGNIKRARKVSRKLRAEGWSVCRIWECRLKKPDSVIRRIRRMLG